MKRFTISLIVFSMICIIFSSCVSKPDDSLDTAGFDTAFIELQQLMLPETADDEVLQILDACGTDILCAVQKKHTKEMTDYVVTQRILIFDAAANDTIIEWIPENAGYYFSGALCARDEAIIASAIDYQNSFYSQYGITYFGADQTMVYTMSGEIQYLRGLEDGSAVFSYVDADGTCGTGRVDKTECQKLLTWEMTDQGTDSAGLLTTWKNNYSYVISQDETLCLLAADADGIQKKIKLEYSHERLDSCCITSRGILACISEDEGTEDAHRSLRLYSDQDQDTLQLPLSPEKALYRICFSETTGLAVDRNWNIHLITLDGDQLGCREIGGLSDTIDAYDGTRVAPFVSGNDTFVLYFEAEHVLLMIKTTNMTQ